MPKVQALAEAAPEVASAPAAPEEIEIVSTPAPADRKQGETNWDLARRRTKEAGGYLSGFCAERLRQGQMAHNCKGAVTNGAGKTSLCTCPCHDHTDTCHQCGQSGVVLDQTSRRCLDRDDCADQIERNHREHVANSKAHQQIREIRASVAKGAPPEPLEGQEGPTDRPAPAKPGKAPRKAAGGTPQRCHEGCGQVTKGGRFAMGHDARLKGVLFKAARGPQGSVRAAAEIVARGWKQDGIVDATLEPAREMAETNPNLLREIVLERYNGQEGEFA